MRYMKALSPGANGLLHDSHCARIIASARDALATAETIPAIRLLESQAALAYWSAWRSVPIIYPKNDLRRVPDHWRTFGTRVSPLTGLPRLAVNPPNAMLNYLYALLESETRLAAAALGLDPGIGLMHVDTDARDSLACDLMEPIRPLVDGYVLDWITREPIRREYARANAVADNCRETTPGMGALNASGFGQFPNLSIR